jgi:hypothetical protein
MGNCKYNLAAVLTVYLITSLCACNSSAQTQEANGYLPYKTDKNISSLLEKAKSQSDIRLPGDDNGFWFFLFKEDLAESIGNMDPHTFFDTLQTFISVPCDCMIKNDSVYVQGGIGYGGGMGFDLRIVNNHFNGNLFLYGKGFRTNQSEEFKKEIFLNSVKQTLSIENKNSLSPGKTVKGVLFMESEDYYEKDEAAPKKIYMKLVFGCKLDEHIAF